MAVKRQQKAGLAAHFVGRRRFFIAAFPASAQTNDPSLTEARSRLPETAGGRRSGLRAGAGPGGWRGATDEAQPDEFAVQGQSSCRTLSRRCDYRPIRHGSRSQRRAPPDADAADANPPPASTPEPLAPESPQQPEPPASPPPPACRPPPGSLAAAPPTVAPVAITGDFVPDEVLVTVDGDAAVAADIAAAFGLEVRSQRTSTLLGSTVVRYGIPDGRPVGVVLAQLAGDGRTTAARAQPHLRPAAGGGRGELRLPAHRARSPTLPAARTSGSPSSTPRSTRRIRR